MRYIFDGNTNSIIRRDMENFETSGTSKIITNIFLCRSLYLRNFVKSLEDKFEFFEELYLYYR